MKIRGVIFDLDGVICHTDEYHYRAWKQIADERNIYFDRTINNRLRGVSRNDSLEIILEKVEGNISEAEKLSLTEKKNKIYVEMLDKMSKDDLSNDVKETLDELKKNNILLAIGSSSKNARLILDKLGLKDYFDFISDGTTISKSKPDPEVFVKAARGLGLSPTNCLVVEDAISGIDAACDGGFKSAGVGEAAGYEKTTYKLSEFKELLNTILRKI